MPGHPRESGQVSQVRPLCAVFRAQHVAMCRGGEKGSLRTARGLECVPDPDLLWLSGCSPWTCSATVPWGPAESTESPTPQVGPGPALSPALRVVLPHTKFENQGVMVRWPRGTLDSAVSVQRWQEPEAAGRRGGQGGSEGEKEDAALLQVCNVVSDVRDGGTGGWTAEVFPIEDSKSAKSWETMKGERVCAHPLGEGGGKGPCQSSRSHT